MKLSKVPYAELNSKQKEIFNFQKVAALLADYGFNCIKLADDWQGADFLAYHVNGRETLRVQLKSRLTINKKYLDKDLFIAFPLGTLWYLVKHDALVKVVGKTTEWLRSESWTKEGGYSSAAPNRNLVMALARNALE